MNAAARAGIHDGMRLTLVGLAAYLLACSPGTSGTVSLGAAGSDPDAAALDAAALDAGAPDAAPGGTCGGTVGHCPIPVDAGTPLGWPAAVSLPPATFWAPGWPLAIAYGQDSVAMSTWMSGGADVLTFGSDPAVYVPSVFYTPTLAPTSRSTFAYVDPATGRLRESRTTHVLGLPVPRIPRPIVGEPAGGFLFTVREPTGEILLERATPDWTFDAAFGGTGSVALPDVAAQALAQGTAAASVVTLLAGDELHRIDGVTGAPLWGPIPVPHVPIGDPEAPVVPGPVLALAPLSNGGVALVQQAGDLLVLQRFDAAGVPAPPQVVSLGEAPLEAAADPGGRVTIRVPPDDRVVRLVRIDAETGALDLGFGAGGYLAIVGPEASGVNWRWTWNQFGVLRDGRAVIGATYERHEETGWVPENLCYALPD